MDKIIRIYTDTFIEKNPGPAGFGVIFELGDRQKEISKGVKQTTKPRIELFSVISGLEQLKPGAENYSIEIYTTSKQIVKAVKENWSPTTNLDLWTKFNWYKKKYEPQIFPVLAKKRTKNNGKCYKNAQIALKNKLFDDKEYYIQKNKKKQERLDKIVEKLEKLEFSVKVEEFGYNFKLNISYFDRSGVIFFEYYDYSLFFQINDEVKEHKIVKERELFNLLKTYIKTV